MRYLFTVCVFAFLIVSATAAPNGSYNFTVMTSNPWPIAVKIQGDRFSTKSNGYVKVLAPSETKSASTTKIVGKTKFTTKICSQPSEVTVTLRFNKDGSFKSGKANGRCNQSRGGVNFSGKVMHD